MNTEESKINGEVTTLVWKEFIESPAGIVLNGVMNAVPGFNGAWVALQQAIEQGKNMRILRAINLLELFNDDDFQKQFIESEQAVDGFLLCYESIIRERNKEKRKIIKNIFLGFTKLSEEEKEEFELERLLDITNRITTEEILIFQEFGTKQSISMQGKELVQTNQQGKIINTTEIDINYKKMPQIVGNKMYPISVSENNIPVIDTVYGLLSLGVICSISLSETKEFNLTILGYKFKNYITK